MNHNNKIDTEKLIRYWKISSEDDYKTMLDMYKTKHYYWSLFMGHLVIEKLLKALYIKTNTNYPPPIHDLRRLLIKSKIELSKEQILVYDTITRFNIKARYDDYKSNFYKLCTAKFTNKWILEIKKQKIWIISLLAD
jgi:HEPN domain-containing protein